MNKEEFWEIYSQFGVNAFIIVALLALIPVGLYLYGKYLECKNQ